MPPIPDDGAATPTARGLGRSASVTTFGVIQPTCGLATGFYRVVRSGVVSIYGLTNNTSISGTASFAVEAGFPADGELASIAVTDVASGFAPPGLSLSDNSGNWFFTWNTAFVSNVTYQIKATAFTGSKAPFTAYDSPTLSLAVTNKIRFPDAYNLAGYLIAFDAQAIQKNGTCHVDIYGEPQYSGTNAIVSVNGTTDANGYLRFTYQDGSTGRGFILPNYDQSGYQYPDTYYKVVVKSKLGSVTNTVTNTVPVEAGFAPLAAGISTKYSIAYMPIYGDPALSGSSAVTLQLAIQAVYTIVENREGGLGVVRGNDQAPFELWNQGDFTVRWLATDLRDPTVRNLFYFGHGAPDFLGTSVGNPQGKLTSADFSQGFFLKPAGQTNAHPFRFVFAFGCNTADGSLCESFGIPRKQGMKRQDFWNKGLRPRAFVGFKNTQLVGWANVLDTTYIQFIGDFYDKWAQSVYPVGHPKAGQPLGLRDALYQAATRGGTVVLFRGYNDLIIYGADDLTFSDFGDIDPSTISP